MKTKLLFTAAFAALIFSACSNEDNSNSNDSLNNYTKSSSDENSGISALQDEALASKTQQFIFEGNGQGSVVFETESGVLIKVDMATLKINGNPVAGAFKLDYVEIFNRSSMVTTNMTTMGVAEEQTDEIPGVDLWQLTSGGEFFVNITTYSGQQLDNGAEVTLNVPAGLTGGFDPLMTAWDGKENKEGDVIWDQEDNAKPVGGREGKEGYELDLDNFGWSNIDRFYSYSGPKTTIQVDVPAGYDYDNCVVYLATEGEQNILARLDTYDPGTELFGEHYGQVPVGLNGYIVFVSEGSGQWEYAIKPVTFAPNDIINIDMGDIMTGSQTDVENAIDAIP